MKTRFKVIISILLLSLSFALVGCGNVQKPDSQTKGKGPQIEQGGKTKDNEEQKKEYNVTLYDGASVLQTKKVKENESVGTLSAREKAGYEFMGWYTDSSKTEKFNPSQKITGDTKIYASYKTYEEVFLAARATTVDSGKFKYDYKMDFSILKKVAGINTHPSAYYRGTVYHNKDGAYTYFKDERIGGGLKLDRHHYDVLKKGESEAKRVRYKYKGSLQPMGKPEKPGKDGAYIDTIQESVSPSGYDYSIFAKSLFKYDDDKIDTIKKEGNKYKVTFKKNVMQKATGFLTKIGMNKVKDELEKKGIDSFHDLEAYVTLDDTKTRIKELYYGFGIRLNFASEVETETEENGGEKTKTQKLKGPIDFVVKYKMTFDNTFDGTINIPQEVESNLI